MQLTSNVGGGGCASYEITKNVYERILGSETVYCHNIVHVKLEPRYAVLGSAVTGDRVILIQAAGKPGSEIMTLAVLCSGRRGGRSFA